MRAAVTGWAWRTPLGDSIDGGVSRLLAGERAARLNPRFDASTYACTLAAPIEREPKTSRQFRYLRRMGLFAVEAAKEAMKQAGTQGGDRLGLFAGIGGLCAHWNDMMPALQHQQVDLTDSWERGFKRLHPFWMLHHLSNNTHALLSIDLGARGEGATFGGASAGAQALSAAILALAEETVDAVLVVAYDSLLEPETLVEQAARGALATGAIQDLMAPYDSNANGRVPGEAAVALILERPEIAGRRALALIDAADGADGSRGEPAARTIAAVAARVAERVSVVDGAGRASPELDALEREALVPLIGRSARLVATSSAMGSLGAATSLVQVIALAECLRRGQLPPIAGAQNLADGPLDPVTRVTPTTARAALGLSTGAPGLVAAVRVELP